jgi:TrfA protein
MTMQRLGLTAQQLQELEERKRNTLEVARQREEAQVVQLPLWREDRRGTPNDFLRSALFAAIQSKDRKMLDGVVLVSQKNMTVRFTGKQLNQEDLDVWEAILHLSNKIPLGTEVSLTGYSILKALKLPMGGEQRRRLEESIDRLTGCFIKLDLTEENSRYKYGGSLIEKYLKNENTGHYLVVMSRELTRLFAPDDWTAINFDQRLQLRSKLLAQFLHGYYSTHIKPHPVKLLTLQELSGSVNKQLSDFKRKVKTALDQLVSVGFLENYSIEGNLVTVRRVLRSRSELQQEAEDKEMNKINYYRQ